MREDGQIAPPNAPIPLSYRLTGFGFAFDPNEPAKEWAGFRLDPGGLVTPKAPQGKNHSDDILGLGLLLVGGTVVAGELFAGAGAGAGAGAEFMGPAAPTAPTVAPPATSISSAVKTAADAINTAAATAANVVGAAAAVKGAWTDPKPKPGTPKPPPDKTDWMLYAAVAVVGVLLLTQGAKA